jgi:antitoxin component of MazEF toxin-antitoxin module
VGQKYYKYKKSEGGVLKVDKERRMLFKRVGRWGNVRVVPLDAKTCDHLGVMVGSEVVILFKEGAIEIRKLDTERILEGIRAQEERIPA